MGRVRNNLVKAGRILAFTLSRLESWADYDSVSKRPSGRLREALAATIDAVVRAGDAEDFLKAMVKAGFVPPKKSLVVAFAVGDRVKIEPKYLAKYRAVYPISALRKLVVEKILPTGEIVVGSGDDVSFLITKSRLKPRAS